MLDGHHQLVSTCYPLGTHESIVELVNLPPYREQRPVKTPEEEVEGKLLRHEEAQNRIRTRRGSHVGGCIVVY